MRSTCLALVLCSLPLATVAANPDPVGRVFGEPVSRQAFDSIRRLYLRSTNPSGNDEEVWRFMALLKESERVGVQANPKQVKKAIATNLRFTVAQHKALQELKRRRIDVATPQGKQVFRQVVLRFIIDKAKPTAQELKDAVRRVYGVSFAEYSEQARREQQVQQYLAQVRAKLQIPEAALRAEWARRESRPVVELYEVPTDAFRPRLDAKPGTPGHITADQIARHYREWKRTHWSTPQVRFEYLGVPFTSATKAQVAKIMDAVADALEAAPAKKKPDLRTLQGRVLPTLTTKVLVHGTLGPVGPKGLAAAPLVDGFATRRWMRTCRPGQTSEVLGGPKGWFVLRALEIKATPTLAQARAQVKRDYALGDPKAVKRRTALRAHRRAEALAVELEVAAKEVRAQYVATGTLRFLLKDTLTRGMKTFGDVAVPDGLDRLPVDAVELRESRGGERLFLWRVAGKKAPASDGFAAAEADLRKLLAPDHQVRAVGETIARAKSVSPALLRYAQQVRQGKRRVRVRRIFVPPDPAILDAWLLTSAKKRLTSAQAELAKGAAWDEVRARYSEAQGDLPNDARVLRRDYGATFVFKLNNLPQNKVSAPIRSRVGLHLVRPVSGKGYWSLQHIVIKVDVLARKPPVEVVKRAWAASKLRIEQAQKELQAGAAFLPTARKYGADHFFGRGQAFSITSLSYFEQAAVTHYLAWNAKGITAKAVPPVVQVATPAGTEWHLFASARDHVLPRYRGDSSTWHIRGKTKAAVEAARAELVDWITAVAKSEGADPSWGRVLARFQAIAKKRSDAPSAAKAGAIGRIDPLFFEVEYGLPFLVELSRIEKLARGMQSEVFRTNYGYHLVLIVAVEQPDATVQREQAIEALLNGTGWD